MLKRPCYYFNTEGKCRFGKHCKFLHNINPTLEDASASPHQHEAVSESSIPSTTASVDQVSTREATSNQHEGLNQRSGATSVEVSSPQTEEICQFYTRTGFCRYGNRCRYKHVRRRVSTKLKEKDQSRDEHVLQQDDGTSKNTVQNETKLEDNSDVKETSSLPDNNIPGSEICWFYAKSGFCRYGNQCKFKHIWKKYSADLKLNVTSGEPPAEQDDSNHGNEKLSQGTDDGKKKKLAQQGDKPNAKRICRFFKDGSCKFGKKCRNFHPQGAAEEKKNDPGQVTEPASVRKPIQIKPTYTRDSLNLELQRKLRETEIQQLKRRFPSEKLSVLEESSECSRFLCTVSPTDPDWPYDIRTFKFEVEFGADYPLKLFNLNVPVEQDLPETVRRYIEVTACEWIDTREGELLNTGVVELVFRPFLRWFDRQLEDIVTEGLKQLRRELTAKAAGFEFIPAKAAKKDAEPPVVDNVEEPGGTSDSEDSNDLEEGDRREAVLVYRKKELDPDSEVYTGPEKSSDEEEDDSDDSDDDDSDTGPNAMTMSQIDLDTARRGTELAFKNMQLWYCTTVMVQKLKLSVQCDRCKNKIEFGTPPKRVNSFACAKCHTTQLAVFRPALAHSYSSTFGYLDLDGCQVVDVILQDCVFAIGCIVCSKEVVVKTFFPGKILEMWCRGCHNKMKFAAETVKFTKLIAAGVDTNAYSGRVHNLNIDRVRKAPKDGAIQEGKSLPDNGACKHYKKSFRWLRFPCCGKTYPCDSCHDDKESHEMIFANRMICGFCCREQPYAAEKPCLGCGSGLTKVRSTHWEGGKGCRDKISMCKTDKQKFANLQKTTSKKSQSLKEKNSGKKNTKLRHT